MRKRTLLSRYYDSPDGEDYLKKLYCIMRPTMDLSMAIGVTDLMLVSKPVGTVPIIVRFCKMTSRPLVTSLIFTTSVYLLTKFRKKDDGWNHALGGALCGLYWHRFITLPVVTIGITTIFCTGLYTFKMMRMEYGGTFWYDYYKMNEETDYGFLAALDGWTWRKKYPRTWLTPEEAAAQGIE